MLTIPTKRILIFALIIGLVFSSGAVALAQDEGTTTDEVEATTTDEVDEEANGILPTNPFYFFKEFSRGVRRFFIFNPVRRAEFELDVLEEKAEELEIVEALNPGNIDAINLALENYNENVDRLRTNLERLAEESDNPNVERLLERLQERTERHNELFEGLTERHGEIFNRVDELRHRWGELVNEAARFRHGENGDEENDDEEGDVEDENNDEEVNDDEDENASDTSESGFFDGRGRFCIALYDPVCGDDGTTYSNECFARIAGVDVVHDGACEEVTQ